MKTTRFFAVPSLCFLLAFGCSSDKPSEEGVDSLQQHWWIVGGYDHGSNTADDLSFLKPEVQKLLASAAEDVDFEKYKYDGVYTKVHSAFHFDNCRFKEGSERLRSHYDEILERLDDNTLPFKDTDPDWRVALRNMGFVFHAVQDFYAHSNWVESGRTDLLDKGLGEWPLLKSGTLVGEDEGMMVLEDDEKVSTDGLPNSVTATMDKQRHVLELFDAFNQPARSPKTGAVVQGLVTGTHENEDAEGACLRKEGPVDKSELSLKHGAMLMCYEQDVMDMCELKNRTCLKPNIPAYILKAIQGGTIAKAALKVAMQAAIKGGREIAYMNTCSEMWRTSYLAKDQPPELVPPWFTPDEDEVDREKWRDDANALARRQTVHEFCRLADLMENRYKGKGRQRLYDAWVSDVAAADAACGVTPFKDKTDKWALGFAEGTRLSVADIDGDEYPDLVVRAANHEGTAFGKAGGQRVWLLKNTRTGSFEDVTEKSKLLSGPARGSIRPATTGRASQVVVFADIDNDGDMDAFSGSRIYKSLNGAEFKPEVLLNDGQGNFSTLASYPFGSARLNPGGATFFDYDRDGDIDLFIPAAKQRANGSNGWLFSGTGSSTAPFTEVTTTSFTSAGKFTQSSVACDLNNDGRQELLVGAISRGPNGLWQSTGADGFSDQSQPSAYAQDDNRDWKDNRGARAFCSFLRSKTKVAKEWFSNPSQCESLPGGCPCTSFPCEAFRDPLAGETGDCGGVEDYGEIAQKQFGDALRWNHLVDRDPSRLGGNTFATICADFNRDGRLDLFNAEQRESREGGSSDPSQVLKNVSDVFVPGNVRLMRPGVTATGLKLPHDVHDWTEGVQSAASFDFDNDGFMDLFIGGSDASDAWGRLYRNDSAEKGTEIHFKSEYLPGMRRVQGVAVADFDRDGDLDLVVGSSARHCGALEACDEEVHFLENQLDSAPPPPQPRNPNQWLQIRPIGQGKPGANRAAIGARVAVELPGGSCTPPNIHECLVQEVDGGHGHFGAQNDRVLHFGLGDLSGQTHVRVSVRWPREDGEAHEQVFDVPLGNKRYELHETIADPVEVPPP